MNEDIMRAAGMGSFVDNVKAGKCPFCGKPVSDKDFEDKPPIFLREFKISGICYPCQVDFFKNDDE